MQVEAEHGMAYGTPLTRVRETVEVIRRCCKRDGSAIRARPSASRVSIFGLPRAILWVQLAIGEAAEARVYLRLAGGCHPHCHGPAINPLSALVVNSSYAGDYRDN